MAARTVEGQGLHMSSRASAAVDWVRHRARIVALSAGVAAITTGCTMPRLSFTERADAHRLASDLRVAFATAAEASNRAVMANTEADAAAAVAEARAALAAARTAAQRLDPVLEALRYGADRALLKEATARLDAYASLDDEVLAMAVESTNVKAQRLSFTDGRAAADAFAGAADARARADRRLELTAARAVRAIREIQALQAPHIAEPDDGVMTALESDIEMSASVARSAGAALAAEATSSQRDALIGALDRFLATNDRIVALSRQNSNVRSLTLALGRKHALASACDERLRQLAAALDAHDVAATR